MPAMAATNTPPQRTPSPLYPTVQSFPRSWPPHFQCCTVMDWAESDCLLGLHWGAWWDSCRKVSRSLSTLPWVQTSTNTPLSGVQTSHSPSISPNLWLELLLPRMQSSCVISLFLWVPSQGYMSPPDFLLFLPNYLCIFLIALVVQALSVCQFPVSFQ